MKFSATGEFKEFLIAQITEFKEDQSASSHWKNYENALKIKISSIKEDKINLILKGFGFGNYHKRNLLGIAKNLPTTIFLKFVLRSSKSTEKADKKISECLGFLRSYDSFRMCKTIDYLANFDKLEKSRKVCVIGDGFGRLGILLKFLYPHLSIIQVNLSKTLTYDIASTLKAFPNCSYSINKAVSEVNDFTFIDSKHKILVPNCDFYINIASMQEMNYDEIFEYFHIITNSFNSFFYCCNRVEKILPDGNVIRFDNYPWEDNLSVIDESICSWHLWQPVNKPPFYKKFDGLIKHKLVKVESK